MQRRFAICLIGVSLAVLLAAGMTGAAAIWSATAADDSATAAALFWILSASTIWLFLTAGVALTTIWQVLRPLRRRVRLRIPAADVRTQPAAVTHTNGRAALTVSPDAGRRSLGGMVAHAPCGIDRGDEEDEAASTARYRDIVSTIPTMTWEGDPLGNITWLSDAWRRYCGLTTDDLATFGWRTLTHPDDRVLGQVQWHEAIRSGAGYAHNRRFRRACDGAWRWHLVRAEPVRGADGAILRWVGSAVDVDDLVRAQAALQEREAELRLFLDCAPAAIAMFDNDMRYLAVTRRFLAAHRVDLEPLALVGRSHYEIFPACPEPWREAHRRVLAGETLSAAEDPFQRAQGDVDWFQWEMTPWHRPDGSIGGALLFAEVVTARVQAEAALRQSEERLRLATEGAGVGTWEIDLTTGRGTWSREAAALSGVAQADFTLQEWAEALHPGDRTRAARALQQAIDAEAGYEVVCRAVAPAPDGSARWLLIRAQIERDATGRALRGVGVVLDVTARHRAEAALADSEARLRTATDNARVGLVVVGEDRRYRFANRAYAEILELSGEIVGSCVADRLAPVYEAQVKARLDKAFRGERVTYELVRPAAAGEADRIYAVTYEPVRTEADELVVVVVVIEISERVQAERALAENEARLRTIVEAVPVGLVIAELPSGRIIGGNAYVERMLRHPVLLASDARDRAEDAQDPNEWVAFHADGTRVDRDEYPLARMALTGEDNPSLEVNYRRGDGTLAWTRIMGRTVRDGAGKLIGGVVALVDVDGERRAHEALATLNRGLEDRILGEVAAREAAQEQAKRAQHMQALGQLAGGVAHEFNNILQAVQGSAGLLERRPSDPERVRKFARVILASAERGVVITSRLLSFAQRARFRSERIEPAAMLSELGEVLARTLGEHIAVRIEHQPGLPSIIADKVQLETVLVSLATNARDAMPEGGTLVLAAVAETLTAGECPNSPGPGRYVRIVVSDTGTGMDRVTLARAAEPFFSTKAPGSGTGLGLSMAKGFAEQSGGALTIDSEQGLGTTVAFWLPVAQDASSDDTTAGDSGRVTRADRQVLIVDDEEMVRETLAAGLEDAGFTVRSANGGEEALALLRTGPAPDVMITDLSMPGMDGLALIREVRELCPGLPAALLTGYAPTDTRLTTFGALPKTCPVLRKPIGPGQLAAALASLLATADAEVD